MTDEIETIQTSTSNYDWKDGPDNVCPADSTMSCQLGQPVKLRLTSADEKRYPPVSVYGLFKKLVGFRPHHDALAFKNNIEDDWIKFSFDEYWKMCNKAAKSFIKLGLDTSECVSILGFNSPQWFISQLGAIISGSVGCGIYTTNSVEQIEYIIKDSGSKIVVVENTQLLEKVIKCKDSCNLKKIIQYSGTIENNYQGLVINVNLLIEKKISHFFLMNFIFSGKLLWTMETMLTN